MEQQTEKISWEDLRVGDLVLCRRVNAEKRHIELILIRITYISAVSIRMQVYNAAYELTNAIMWRDREGDYIKHLEFIEIIERAKEKEDSNAMKSAARHHLDALLKFVEECYLTEHNHLVQLISGANSVRTITDTRHFNRWEESVIGKLESLMEMVKVSSDDEGTKITKRAEALIKVIIEGWAGLDKYLGKV